MSTPAKHMLLSAISQHSNYKEKQLARSGELGASAASIIKRLRRTVRLYHALYFTFPVSVAISQIVAWGFPSDLPTRWFPLVCYGLILIMQIPGLVRQHVSLSRLETIVAMWLYTSSDETDRPLNPDDTEASKMVASTF